MRRRALLFLAASAAGCASNLLQIDVKTQAETNQRKPLYAVVRSVEAKAFLAESYDDAVAKFSQHDPSVLTSQLVYPGRSYQLKVKKPDKSAVGVYFLFTAPGGSWRLLLDPPLPAQVQAELGKNQIRSDSRK